MRVSKPRNRAALAMLALAAAAVFVLPASSASAGTATVANACANSVTPNFSQIDVTTSGDDEVTAVPPGAALTLSGLSQSAAIPGDIFVAGYNLGLLTTGMNNIPANVRSTIEATNTVQGQQLTNTVGGSPPNGTVTVTTTITDPDGAPGTGDETATPASFSVTYNNLTWTTGAGGTIEYRQESIPVAPPTAANNTLLINALVGGVFNVQFRCAPGTVTPPDPGTITLTDPASSFDTTGTCLSVPVISIDDQTVIEGGAATFTVSFFGCGAGFELATVDFATADGTAVAPGDYTSASGTVTFLPGDVSETVTVQTIADNLIEGDETFDVNLSNATNAVIADGTGVGTILNTPAPVIDATGIVILNGPVTSAKTSKSFVFKVTNVGMTPITINPGDLTSSVDVNGVATGSVSVAGLPVTLDPGSSKRLKLSWSYDGSLATGDTVVFHACLSVAGDINPNNDCDDATATAK